MKRIKLLKKWSPRHKELYYPDCPISTYLLTLMRRKAFSKRDLETLKLLAQSFDERSHLTKEKTIILIDDTEFKDSYDNYNKGHDND